MTGEGRGGGGGWRTMTTSAVCFPVFSPPFPARFTLVPLTPSTIMIEDCVIDTLVGDIGTCSNSTTENLINSDSVQKQVKK